MAFRPAYPVPALCSAGEQPECSRVRFDGDYLESRAAEDGNKVHLRPIGRRAFCAEDREDLSVCSDGGSLPVPGIEPAGGESRDHSTVAPVRDPMRLIFERTGRNAVKSWMVCGKLRSNADDSEAATPQGLQFAPILPGWPGQRPRPSRSGEPCPSWSRFPQKAFPHASRVVTPHRKGLPGLYLK